MALPWETLCGNLFRLSVPQFTVCRMATSDDVGKSVVSSEGFVGHSLSALVPLQCSSLVASPSPPSLGVLVTKLSLRSRIWEGSYHTPYPQFPCLKGHQSQLSPW